MPPEFFTALKLISIAQAYHLPCDLPYDLPVLSANMSLDELPCELAHDLAVMFPR